MDDQRIALITGATAGIGEAIAHKLGKQGFNLVLTGRRKERLDAIAITLYEKYQVELKTLHFDVRNQKETETALNQLPVKWQSIDVLINNAGLAKGFHDIHEGKLQHWETMIDTNMKGLLYVTRVVSPWMVARKAGQIINISSIAGHEVYPKGNVYCGTKHAVDAMTKGMRLDLHKYNIRVSSISPGHVETEFAVVRFDGDEERAKIYEDFNPLTAFDVAEAAWYVIAQPPHVTVHDILLTGTQQASATTIQRDGRKTK